MRKPNMPGDWRQFEQYPEYWFSSDGVAVKIVRGKDMVLSGTKCGQMGYRAIGLPNGGRVYLHRAICELFNGAPREGQMCRHLDGVITNNAASNLRWGTSQENSMDMRKHGTVLYGSKNPMAKLTAEEVEAMRAKREMEGTPYYQLAEIFNVSTMTAFRAATRRSWTA